MAGPFAGDREYAASGDHRPGTVSGGVTDRVDEPRLLGAGRDADVFALTDGRVLRRYRDGSDATAEAELMAFVATHGFPVPTLHSATGPELVMELLDGPTMGAAVESGALDARAAGSPPRSAIGFPPRRRSCAAASPDDAGAATSQACLHRLG